MNRWMRNGVLFGLALVAAFVAIEGLSSLAIFGFDVLLRPNTGPRSSSHAQHDSLLGWISVPSYSNPDEYGRGASLTINSQSFRSEADVPAQVPPGMVRVLCSGDSFTLGFGVGDGQTWCDLLSVYEPRFQTVNMGEAGYGVGQAFLKYEREAAALDYDIHIFAFLSEDIRRLGRSTLVGWPKPVVTVRDGNLVVENVPVPRRSFFLPWYTYNRGRFSALRVMQLGQRLTQRFQPASSPVVIQEKEAEIRQVAVRIFERIQQLNSEKESVPVFVFLPMGIPEGSLERDRLQFFRRELEVRGLWFIDLATEFRRRPYSELDALFDKKWEHFSVRGNEYAARLLLDRLLREPRIQRKLATHARGAPPE